MLDNVMTLIEDIKADYFNYTSRNGTRELTEVNKKMISEFNASLGYVVGSKYIKITKDNNGSVWGFIVKGDNDKKFKKGDILKAASWATPARNHRRGNIVEGGYSIHWTGPHYM